MAIVRKTKTDPEEEGMGNILRLKLSFLSDKFAILISFSLLSIIRVQVLHI